MADYEEARNEWLRLAELLAGAPSDDEAAALFRAVTGLTGIDPEADKAELARRVAECAKQEPWIGPAPRPRDRKRPGAGGNCEG